MYLTAHHVISPVDRREGINAFLYLHGSYVWEQVPAGIPDENRGTLVAQSLSIRPPGNRVRSYMDIVAPDEARWEEVRIGLMDVVRSVQLTALPWVGHSGRCYFRIGMEIGLACQWQRELATLYRTAQALRIANPK
jgi:hypothetical protein